MNVYLTTQEIKTLIDGMDMAVDSYKKELSSLRIMKAPDFQIDYIEKLIKDTLKLITNLQKSIK
jgi:hypothetical protein